MTSPLQSQVQLWQELRRRLLTAMPELADDPDCLLDTLEGETDVHGQLAELYRTALDDAAMAEGIQGRIEKLQARQAWLQGRAKKKRAVVLNYMLDLGIPRIKADDMTISTRKTQPGCIVTDETLLPEAYVRTEREPDKAAIRKALLEGETVPGAELGNQSETLTVKI